MREVREVQSDHARVASGTLEVIRSVLDVSNRQVASTGEIEAALRSLEGYAQRLQDEVGRFKV